MQWQGEGLIIGVRRHGENAVILEVMSEGRGRHLGLVRGGRSRKFAATLQAGNSVHLTWRARLEEHLGIFEVELAKPRAAQLIADRNDLLISQLLCAHLRLLPERDAHDQLLNLTIEILDCDFAVTEKLQMLALFELYLLDELGFGLDLSACAVSGETTGLTHVSPKTGRAVTLSAAEPYIEKLFALPAFLLAPATATSTEIDQAFALTGHFLHMHIWNVRQMDPPPMRDQLIATLR